MDENNTRVSIIFESTTTHILTHSTSLDLYKSNNQTSTTHPKMNNIDSHPRVLSLSSASPNTSTSSTPATQSTRASHESAHDAHHFVNQQENTHKTLNGSIKKMWKEIKHHAAEHHRSVNAAYRAQYGAGAGAGARPL